MRILTGLILASALSAGACKGQITETPTDTNGAEQAAETTASITNPVDYRFATKTEAGDILTNIDDHFGSMQKREMGVRLKNPVDPTIEKLSAQYRAAVLDFSDEEVAFLNEVVEDSRAVLAPFRGAIPDEVLFAKISNDIEGGLPHTRGNLILFSKFVMDGYLKTRESDPEKAHYELKKLFLHELHHVMSRANPERVDEYFAIIGFKRCAFTEPEDLRLSRLTNPDATAYHHYAPVEIQGTDGLIPYLRVSSAYDADRGGSMGSYMNFALLRVDVDNGKCTATNETPQFVAPVPDFMELIGQNTGYIIHPEETLSDNFVHYVLKTEGLPNPEIPEAVAAFWKTF